MHGLMCCPSLSVHTQDDLNAALHRASRVATHLHQGAPIGIGQSGSRRFATKASGAVGQGGWVLLRPPNRVEAIRGGLPGRP